MERFRYRAKRGLQETVEDTIDADSQEEALNLLAARGLFPVSIEKASVSRIPASHPDTRGARGWRRRIGLPRRGLASRDRALFTRKLATLVTARVELLSALKVLHDQADDERFRELVQTLLGSIKEGQSFSESLRKVPGFFDAFYISMVKAGEASGRLDLALEQVSGFLENQEKLRTRVLAALAYPALLVCVGFASVAALIVFVIPKLAPVLRGMGRELPAVTRMILGISDLAHNHTMPLLLGAGALCCAVILQRKNPRVVAALRKLPAALPMVSDLVRNQALANFSWSLALLVRSGIPVYQALRVSSQVIGDAQTARRLEKVCDRLRQGQTLSASMEGEAALPPFFIRMLAIGEESGKLPDVLQQISGSYAQEVETSVSVISSLLEPCLILVLGAVLGLIVFSLMLPLFEITQMIR